METLSIQTKPDLHYALIIQFLNYRSSSLHQQKKPQTNKNKTNKKTHNIAGMLIMSTCIFMLHIQASEAERQYYHYYDVHSDSLIVGFLMYNVNLFKSCCL